MKRPDRRLEVALLRRAKAGAPSRALSEDGAPATVTIGRDLARLEFVAAPAQRPTQQPPHGGVRSRRARTSPPEGRTIPDDDTSSADPQALIAYSEAGLRIDAQLEASATRLEAVLAEFQATCTDYPLGIGPEMVRPLRDLIQRNREHNLWVRQVAEDFQRADAAGTPEPVAFVTPQPSPVPEPVGTPTVPPAETGPTPSLPAWDFWASRVVDGATEASKAAVRPQWIERLVPQVVGFAQREATTVLTEDQQVVADTVREATEWVIGLRPVQELANAPAVALKDFLASPVKGVPIVGGAVQGTTDAFEPDLAAGQRVKRIAIAAGSAVLVAGLVSDGPRRTRGRWCARRSWLGR